MTASKHILRKALVASDLDSSQWNSIQAGLRNRAFFSSQVARANILDAARRLSAEYAGGHTDLSKLRIEWRKFLERENYKPDPEEEGTIKDLYSRARIDVIVKTNVAQARGFMQYAEGMTPGAFAAFPAQEFTRIVYRKQKREDWPQRWARAGGKVYGGRMIALKDDPVWQRLGNAGPFGNPYPPFDWGSGMGVMDIDRAEAIKLGLISDEDLRDKTAEMREKPIPSMNDGLRATVTTDDVNVDELKGLFGEQFGDLVKVDGNVVKWRAEVLDETLLQKKDFSVDLGVPGVGLLKKLLDNPTTSDFAYAVAGKQLAADQTWRDTKRREGGTHIRHFVPTPGHVKKHPEEVPLKPEDMEMLPTMWRNPDRVIKLQKDLFLAELDAFDGSTYMMQVKLEDTGPKLWTFFRTTNPVSRKIARSTGGTI